MKNITNTHVLEWIEQARAMTEPEGVTLIDGGEEQLADLRLLAERDGDLIRLNGELLPGCWLHRSDPGDVARVEERTFICSETESEAGPTNNWAPPAEMYARLRRIYSGCMRERQMYVIPYSMGPVGSSCARYGVELTDSIYVVLSMAIMTAVGTPVLEAMGQSGDFVRGLHSKASLDPEKRYIAHFPQDGVIMSVNSDYGGNALLGKKCHALRMASVLARREGWMAEHMMIVGIQGPEGRVEYICGAFPSACGKTNMAMLIPPELYRRRGWKCWTVGDDIAWLHIGDDGRLWAINPERGFFGVAPGTSERTNPNALASTRKNTIFTNVVRDTDTNTVWWEGMSNEPPVHAEDWKGQPWTAASGVKGAHPNSRFTAPAENCPCLSSEYGGDGVPISAIIFGGRRTGVVPLVYEARDWAHGVFLGSTLTSETTAAAAGQVGVIRHDPMAMKPFCGYNMADYWGHWLDMGERLTRPPKVFCVNWFRTDENGKYLWPGFGDNIRVLEWMIKRCRGQVQAVQTPVGLMPLADDVDLEDCPVSRTELADMLSVDKQQWLEECSGSRAFLAQFGDRLPVRLMAELEKTETALRQ